MKQIKFKILLGTILIVSLVSIAIKSTSLYAEAIEALPVAGTSNTCAGKSFVSVQADPKNTAYPAPALQVSCSGATMTVVSNGIPNFEFVQVTPSRLRAQNYRWTMPKNPKKAARSSPVPLQGPIGVAANGIPIFGPTEAPNDGYGDPYLDGMLDFCNGHTAPRGDYHFHARPDCIKLDVSKPGTVIGYAFDGYPILTPYVCADATCKATQKLKSSWQLSNAGVRNAWQKHSYTAGSGDLDQCNGKTQADGSYAYYATDTFPYFIGCYVGTPTANIGATGRP